jgi:DNA-binding response OmpR family regulator
MRILVVDDEPAQVSALRRVLAREGYEVETACDGEEALEKIFRADDVFDLVLLDLKMPNFNGWDFMKIKRMSTRRLAHTAVVIVSGAIDEDKPEGVAVMFEKPVDLQQLLAAIKHFSRDTTPPPAPPSAR